MIAVEDDLDIELLVAEKKSADRIEISKTLSS